MLRKHMAKLYYSLISWQCEASCRQVSVWYSRTHVCNTYEYKKRQKKILCTRRRKKNHLLPFSQVKVHRDPVHF